MPQPAMPLASAELAIESATLAAWRRCGTPRTLAAELGAKLLVDQMAAGVRPRLWLADSGLQVELIRLAGLRAVRAAVEDDDMQALQAELVATLAALAP